jgi:hypothetical protein
MIAFATLSDREDIPFERPQKAGKTRCLIMLAVKSSHRVVPVPEPETRDRNTYMNEGREAL